MRKSVSTFLAAAVLAASARYSHANTITTFIVSGTAFNISEPAPGFCTPDGTPCAFFGTLAVDVTAGTITGVNITFPGLSAFDAVSFSGANGTSDWEFLAENSDPTENLDLSFTTASTPGSLVGFDGGSIIGGGSAGGSLGDLYFTILAGSIAVSEPGSFVLMLAGLSALALGLFVMRRRAAFGNR